MTRKLTELNLLFEIDALEPLPVLTYTFMNDWGGDSDKDVLSLRTIAMAPPAATKGFVDLWVTRRDAVPWDASAPGAPLAWPPARCLVAAQNGAPTFDHLLAAAAAAAGVAMEDAVVARHEKASWVVLAAGMAASGGGKKGSKKGKGGGSGGAGAKGSSSSGGARNVTQAPFNVKHGDLIGVIDRRALAAAANAGMAGADVGASEALPSSGAARWWESAAPASSDAWARAFDAPADREARDAAAAAAGAAAAAAGGGGGKKGGGKKPKEKEIALELGAEKDWERDSDDDEGDALDENDEAFGEDAD
jgi:hypothetical protein